MNKKVIKQTAIGYAIFIVGMLVMLCGSMVFKQYYLYPLMIGIAILGIALSVLTRDESPKKVALFLWLRTLEDVRTYLVLKEGI